MLVATKQTDKGSWNVTFGPEVNYDVTQGNVVTLINVCRVFYGNPLSGRGVLVWTQVTDQLIAS